MVTIQTTSSNNKDGDARCSGNALGFYSWVALFESRLGHRLSWLRYFVVLLVRQCKGRDNNISITLRLRPYTFQIHCSLTNRRYTRVVRDKPEENWKPAFCLLCLVYFSNKQRLFP
jgi:hypothetical protein